MLLSIIPWKLTTREYFIILQFDNEWDDLIRLVTDEVHDSEVDQVELVNVNRKTLF